MTDWVSQNLSFDEVISLIDEQLARGELLEESPWYTRPDIYTESGLYQSWFSDFVPQAVDRWMARHANATYHQTYEHPFITRIGHGDD